ncbi:MAG: hypothetical protein O3C45_11445, partial [Bacteroidetes bacterium]|nr:hypothetical protein [Bacteroidota bacterium]
MPKKGLRRFQLFLLLVVGGLIVWRMTAGPEGEGFLTLSDPGLRSLKTAHFQVLEPTVLHIEGEVSFEDDKPGSDLAVVAWILDRGSNEPVWRSSADGVKREGVRALVDDSLRLDPGLYSAYLSTYGPDDRSHDQGSAFGLKPHWTNYASFWHLDLRAPEGTVDVERSVPTPSGGRNALFRMPLRDRGNQRVMLHAEGPATLRLQGGITRCNSRCDDMSVRSLTTGQVIWTLDQADAVPAGGSPINHWVDTEIPLPDGVFEFVVQTGGHPGRWSENPPWQPDDFVLTLEPTGSGQVSLVDPWNSGQPLVDHTGLGDDALVETRIETSDSLDIIVYGLGELRPNAQRYDWGWIESEATGEKVWEMSWENSSPAGGDSDNRQTMAILTLPPGRYLAGFRTDGSHSYRDFNRSRPEHPERWGMAIFTLDGDRPDPGQVRLERIERETPAVVWEGPSGSAL